MVRLQAARGPQFAMVGFRMANTLSEHGAVSRGVTRVAAEGMLGSIVETHGITAEEIGPGKKYSGAEFVSMNCWGFTPALFAGLGGQFQEFLRARRGEPLPEVGDAADLDAGALRHRACAQGSASGRRVAGKCHAAS